MDTYSLRVALNQIKMQIDGAVAALAQLDDTKKEVATLEKRRVEAETAYKQAHGERVQIIEAIENLKKQYETLAATEASKREASLGDAEASVLAAKQTAEKRIAELSAEVKKAESDAAQRIARAETASGKAEEKLAEKVAAYERFKAL